MISANRNFATFWVILSTGCQLLVGKLDERANESPPSHGGSSFGESGGAPISAGSQNQPGGSTGAQPGPRSSLRLFSAEFEGNTANFMVLSATNLNGSPVLALKDRALEITFACAVANCAAVVGLNLDDAFPVEAARYFYRLSSVSPASQPTTGAHFSCEGGEFESPELSATDDVFSFSDFTSADCMSAKTLGIFIRVPPEDGLSTVTYRLDDVGLAVE